MDELAHLLKIQYGLAPGEPTEEQTKKVLAQIAQFTRQNGREPKSTELGEIVRSICPSYKTWKYAADVQLELRRQLAMLATQIKR